MQLSRQEGWVQILPTAQNIFFTNTISNFVIVTELVYFHSRMIFKKVKITFKTYSAKHSPGVEPQFSDLKPDALPLHHLYISQNCKKIYKLSLK
jgi:hypothetical protein